MGFVKIPQLPPATLPLDGTELVEIVQGGISKKTLATQMGAPANATFLVLTSDGILSQERVFTPSTGLTAIDGGAGNPYILSINQGFSPIWTGLHQWTQPVRIDGGAIGLPDLPLGTAGLFSIDTGGSERLRITSAGAWGLGGANYGTVGQVLSSGGPGVSPGWSSLPAPPAGANPSASVGLTVVNGVATTFLRSDGAPALSQAIAPTWTGQHGWTLPLRGPAGTAGAPAISFTGDTDTGIYSAGTNILGFATAAGLRFQIGAAGQFGIGGATYGNSGEVLTSGGAGAAPSWAPPAGGITGLANPTATLGLSAINGSATTAMRSDAAPALSQSIAPTWTGLHVFARSATDKITVSGPVSNSRYQSFESSNGSPGTLRWRIGMTSSAESGGNAGSNFAILGYADDGSSNTANMQILRADGQIQGATTPSITYSFVSDEDTGMGRVGSNTLGFYAAGNERVRIQNGANALNLTALDSVGDCYIGFYEPGFSPLKGYLGYADGATDNFYIRNSENAPIIFNTNGTNRWTISSAGILEAAHDGTAAAPIITWSSDLNTGIYRSAADTLSFATAGAEVFKLGSTGRAYFTDGSAGFPSIAFNADIDVGFYRVAGNVIGISAGGVLKAAFRGSNEVFRLYSDDPDGDIYMAFYESNADTNRKGYIGYPNGANDNFAIWNSENAPMDLATNNISRLNITAGGQLNAVSDGSAAAPAWSFNSDANTGIYRIGTDTLGFAEGGGGFAMGYRGMVRSVRISNVTLVQTDNGRMLQLNSGVSSVTTGALNADSTVVCVNNTGGSVSVICGGTMSWFTGSAVTTGSPRTVANGGVFTLQKADSTNNWFIWGSGIT